MKLARVIGRVVLNVKDPSFLGGRFLVAIPCRPDEATGPLPKGNSLVVFDNLGASEGDLIGFSDGGEASAPFKKPTPCDAFNCAILDQVSHKPYPNSTTH
jgi:ethanolamine utilization protein EutN